MKYLSLIAAVVCAVNLNAASLYPLVNGINDVPCAGEIVGIECVTVDASQSVTASVIVAVTEYTNAYKSVTSPHLKYEFTITNYDGNASIATNVLDKFAYSDWYTTNGLNKIVGDVKTSTTNITQTVENGKLAKATYTKETAIGSGSASSHYLKITPANTQYLFGGKVKVDCGAGDNVTILIK